MHQKWARSNKVISISNSSSWGGSNADNSDSLWIIGLLDDLVKVELTMYILNWLLLNTKRLKTGLGISNTMHTRFLGPGLIRNVHVKSILVNKEFQT